MTKTNDEKFQSISWQKKHGYLNSLFSILYAQRDSFNHIINIESDNPKNIWKDIFFGKYKSQYMNISIMIIFRTYIAIIVLACFFDFIYNFCYFLIVMYYFLLRTILTHISRNVMTHYFPSNLTSNLCRSMATFGECKMCGNCRKQEIELLKLNSPPWHLILHCHTPAGYDYYTCAQSCKMSWIS